MPRLTRAIFVSLAGRVQPKYLGALRFAFGTRRASLDQFGCRRQLRQHAAHLLGVAGGHVLRAVVVAHLRAAAALGLQVRQAGFTALDFAGSGQRHALGRRFTRFHLVAHSNSLK